MSNPSRYLCCELHEFLMRNKAVAHWQPIVPAQSLRPPNPPGIFGAVKFDHAYSMLADKTFFLPEMGCLHVRDAHVAGYGLVTCSGSALLDRNFTIAYEELGQHGYFTDIDCGERGHLDFQYKEVSEVPDAVLLLHRGDTVHGHWLLEVLPRVILSKKSALEDPFYIVSSEILEYQIEMLEAVGVHRERIIKIGRDETIYCRNLVVPSIAHANLLWIHPFANETFNQLVDFAAASIGAHGRTEKLFITRSSRQGDTRPLINMREVTDVLADKGFKTVDPGQVKWIEQVNLFAKARIVVGIGGSGMHNTAFCGAAVSVLTLQPNQNWNYLQASIAAIRQHRNSFFFGEAMAAFDQKSWETPFAVDQDLLALVVSQTGLF